MRLENDENFTFLYNEEFEKIPFLFRFSRKRLIVVVIIMGIAFLAGAVFLDLFYSSGTYVKLPTVDEAHTLGVNIYNDTYLIYMILCFVVIALLAAWIVLAKLFEKRAFRKVSLLCNMIDISERNRVSRVWSDWKMNNRDY